MSVIIDKVNIEKSIVGGIISGKNLRDIANSQREVLKEPQPVGTASHTNISRLLSDTEKNGKSTSR